MLVTSHFIGRQREGIVTVEFNLLDAEISKTHFRPRQIGHDGDPSSHLTGGSADVLDNLLVTGELTMREIEPRDVHSCADHFPQYLWRLRRRANRRDNLGFVSEGAHGFTPCGGTNSKTIREISLQRTPC